MKNLIKKFIIILILITMGLEIILPINVSYADGESVENPAETPVEDPAEDPKYSTIWGDGEEYFAFADIYDFERYHPSVVWEFGISDTIYYIEDGEKKYPEVTSNGIVKLEQGKEYHYLNQLSDGTAIKLTYVDKEKFDLDFYGGHRDHYEGEYYSDYEACLDLVQNIAGKTQAELSASTDRYLISLTGKNIDGRHVNWSKVITHTGWYRLIDVEEKNGHKKPENFDIKTSITYFDKNKKPRNPTYRIENIDGEEIVLVFLVKNKLYNAYSYVTIEEYIPPKVSKLESMLAKFVYSLGNGIQYLLSIALGQTLTIDDLVFNDYSETNISFFEDKDKVENPSSLLYGTEKVGGLNTVVNDWYSIFIKIALMGYMVMLVYMGIRIMLTSTAEEKANCKKLFVDWVIGLAILLLFPYAMKYMIKLNESLVEIIAANKSDVAGDTPSSAIEAIDDEKDLTDIAIDYEVDWSLGQDYMSSIALLVLETHRLGVAIAFIIMTWQLIVLAFHYFKRLFMVAFLIIIFPLVGLFYAIDKIADGKSQAFNTWLKEFILCVFIQTFHAIVYVFVCSTVYSASGHASTGHDYDVILIIVGATFLFNGEAIIRQIFGQISSAESMKKLSDSAAGTFAKMTMVTGAIKNVGDYTVGKKSIANKLIRGGREVRAINKRLGAFDKTATTPEDYNTGARLEHAPVDPGEGATEEQKKNFLKERDIFKAAAIFNNPNSYSMAERAKALETLKNVAKENPNHDVFKDTKATAGQIAALGAIDHDVERMVDRGMKRLDIEREVTARIGIIFPEESDEKIKDRVGMYFTSLYLNGSNETVSKNKTKREVNNIIKEVKEIREKISFAEDDGTSHIEYDSIYGDVEEILNRYNEEALEKDADISVYAANLAILRRRESGNFTEIELLEAADYIRNHQNDNDINAEMIEEELDVDADILMHTLAKKISEESTSDENRAFAKEIVDDYEENAREGYFDDEISVHEIIKEIENEEELNNIIEEVYQNKKEAMKEATEKLGKQHLVENQIDIMKNSYDTTVRTQDGYTEEELLAMKVDAIGRTLSNIAAVNKESTSSDSDGILGWIMKNYLAKKEEERLGITRSMEERRDVYNPIMTTQDFIEKNKAERDRIQNEHFMGDIGDRK